MERARDETWNEAMEADAGIRRYRLGCPAWGFQEWRGSLYRRKTPARDFLRWYARVFNAVEGNTTFYSLPAPEVVPRWREATPPGFRFCFKLPRTVTHELQLEDSGAETVGFFRRLEPLGERLGPFMVQLPPSFGPGRLAILDRFLCSLPGDHRFAVELRHRSFFASDDAVRRIDELLAARGCERVVLDTRPLRAGDPSHPDLRAARHRKPDLPVHPAALGPNPLLRLICHPDPAVSEPFLAEWAERVAGWIEEGRRPYAMVHSPSNLHAPQLARRFHELLNRRVDVGEMPPWPGERQEVESGQLRLL